MQGRSTEQQTDQLFTAKFYQYSEEVTELTIAFPLPESAETLADFLKSDQGAQFRAGITTLMDALIRWMGENQLQSLVETCERFKRIYTEYTCSDPATSNMYYSFYTQGLPHLSGICKLLASQTISTEFCRDTIHNLVTGMIVCPPGAATNIADAYWKLAAQLNVPLEFMAARRQFVQQLLLKVYKP